MVYEVVLYVMYVQSYACLIHPQDIYRYMYIRKLTHPVGVGRVEDEDAGTGRDEGARRPVVVPETHAGHSYSRRDTESSEIIHYFAICRVTL